MITMDDMYPYVEMWSAMKVFMPAKEHEAAAEKFISVLDENSLVDFTHIDGILYDQEFYGVCDIFDSALISYCKEVGYIIEEDDEEEYE